MFYLTTYSTHFIYGYMASDIWLRTILIVRKETRCHHTGYSYRFLLYAPSHRQDNTYHSLCYASHGALAGTRNRSDDPSHHERTLLPRSYISLRPTITQTDNNNYWMEREIAQWVHYEGSIRRPIAPWSDALTTELHLAPTNNYTNR